MSSGGKSDRKGTTDNGRTTLTSKTEQPKSARGNKELYQLYKFAITLELNEIEFLVSKRRNDIKYMKTLPEEAKRLRTEILLLEDVHRIRRREIREGLG